MTTSPLIKQARQSFHAQLQKGVLWEDEKGIPSIADKHSKPSVAIAKGILSRLGNSTTGERLAGQKAGKRFEELCAQFLTTTFLGNDHLRPGNWEIGRLSGIGLADYDQYSHLAALERMVADHRDLATVLGNDYIIKPDIIIGRVPESDKDINHEKDIVGSSEATLTSLRAINNPHRILHASISCKWTLRSDRAQNARSEALNLIRNRKGRVPHIAVVTGEPMPSRIASIALGTGDIDCVYHFALPELQDTIANLQYDDAGELLTAMVEGKRLRDISDLPFDLMI